MTKLLQGTTGFIAGIRGELRLMEWVKGRELVRYTLVVVFYLLALTLLVYGVDQILVLVRSALLGTTTL